MAFYKRHLPHWQPESAEFFVTFRLADSLPNEAVNRLKIYRRQIEKQDDPDTKNEMRRNIFKKYEDILDNPSSGPTWLKKEKIASTVKDALHFYDNKQYDLYAYCIMPNHVHVAFRHFLVDK